LAVVSGLSSGQLNVASIAVTAFLACGFTVVIALWGTRTMQRVMPSLSRNLHLGESQFALAMCFCRQAFVSIPATSLWPRPWAMAHVWPHTNTPPGPPYA